jgi:hypothetical protein
MSNGQYDSCSFVETWKCIADAMDRSERWCRYMARRAEDPLPVYKMGGIIRMNITDRDEWLRRARCNGAGMSSQSTAAVGGFLRLIA